MIACVCIYLWVRAKPLFTHNQQEGTQQRVLVHGTGLHSLLCEKKTSGDARAKRSALRRFEILRYIKHRHKPHHRQNKIDQEGDSGCAQRRSHSKTSSKNAHCNTRLQRFKHHHDRWQVQVGGQRHQIPTADNTTGPSTEESPAQRCGHRKTTLLHEVGLVSR